MLTQFLDLFSVGKLVVANRSGDLSFFLIFFNQERFLLNLSKNQSYQVINNHGDLMAESLFKAEIASVGDEALEIRVGQQVLGR